MGRIHWQVHDRRCVVVLPLLDTRLYHRRVQALDFIGRRHGHDLRALPHHHALDLRRQAPDHIH